MQPQQIAQLQVLLHFDPANYSQGIKIHQHTADKRLLEAAEQLFNKGLLSQPDGGYLTALGQEACEYIHNAIQLLSPPG